VWIEDIFQTKKIPEEMLRTDQQPVKREKGLGEV
jgi:hypothetical protein